MKGINIMKNYLTKNIKVFVEYQNNDNNYWFDLFEKFEFDNLATINDYDCINPYRLENIMKNDKFYKFAIHEYNHSISNFNLVDLNDKDNFFFDKWDSRLSVFIFVRKNAKNVNRLVEEVKNMLNTFCKLFNVSEVGNFVELYDNYDTFESEVKDWYNDLIDMFDYDNRSYEELEDFEKEEVEYRYNEERFNWFEEDLNSEVDYYLETLENVESEGK